ncbi:MAG: hypothetical protein ABWX84_02900 [Nocardioides sp.]
MSTPQDNLTEQLGRELHDRGASVPGNPIGLGDVKRTAGRIRRRRQVAGGVIVAAAAAVIVPSVMVAGNLLGGDAAPEPAPAPSVTQSPKPAPSDGPIVLDADAPQGADPQLTYLDGVLLIDSAGNKTELDVEYTNITRAGDEFLATRYGDPVFSVDVLDAEGRVRDSSPTGTGAVGSADGTVGAWVTPDGKVMTRFQGRTVQLNTVTGGSPEAVEILGSGSCMEAEGGCRVFVNHQDGSSRPQSVDSHGIVDVVPGGMQIVRAVSPEGLIAGLVTKPDADPSAPACSAIYDEQAGKRLFRTCDFAFGYGAGFSPDGSRIVAQPQDADGLGPRSVVVLDSRTGDTVAEIEVPDANTARAIDSITDTAWEDAGHLLVKTDADGADGPSYSMFRVDLTDGTVERVFEERAAGGEVQPWRFLH